MRDAELKILLYDDDPDVRKQLKTELETQGVIIAPEDPGKVIEAVRQDPDGFDFILIDHVFKDIEEGDVLQQPAGDKPIKTGLDLCHKVSRINPNIPIILYTTVSEQAPWNEEAVAMGASRVVMQKELPELVSQLQQELRDLSEISSRLDEIQLGRRGFSHVIAGLAVGFQVVDRYGRIWFRDDVFRRIVGDSGLPYEICYCKCHGYDIGHGICPNCLVRKVIVETRKEDMLTYYSPTYPGGAGSEPEFQYLSVQVSPIYGKGVTANGSPIAAIEAVSRVPYGRIAELGLNEHLEMLARGLEDMGFKRVRVYRADKSRGSKHGLVRQGPIGQDVDFATVDVPLREQPKLDQDEAGSLVKIVSEHDFVDMNHELRRKLAFQEGHEPICVALFDATGDFIGWVALDNGIYPVGHGKSFPVAREADLKPEPIGDHIRPSPLKIIEEIARVIASKPLAHAAPAESVEVATAERWFERIRMRIAADITGESVKVIEPILEAVQKEVPGLDMAHVRSVEGGLRAVLVASIGDYGLSASTVVDIRISNRETAIVARTGVPEYVGTCEELERTAGMGEFDPEQKEILARYASHAVYPLLDEGQVVGTVSFQSAQEHFFEGRRRHLFQFVADLLARALHDHLSLTRERERVATEIGKQAAALVVHNVSGPLGAIRNCVLLAKEDLRTDPEVVTGYLSRIDEHCLRIARVRGDLLKLFKHVDEEPQVVDLHEVISRAVTQTVTGFTVNVQFQMDPAIARAAVRLDVTEACLEVLSRNAVDAMRESNHDAVLLVVLRGLDATNSREREFSGTCVAVDVIDNGSGVSPEAKSRLFEPFQSSKQDGLGIGLAYARYTVRASGGDIYYAEEEPRGTRFTFLLPASPANTIPGGRE